MGCQQNHCQSKANNCKWVGRNCELRYSSYYNAMVCASCYSIGEEKKKEEAKLKQVNVTPK